MITILPQFIFTFTGTYCFSILLNAPRKMCVLCALGGTITWISYLFIRQTFGVAALGFFIATLIVTIYSRFASVFCKIPVITFITPGIFPVVPGAGIYYTAYYLFTGDSVMAGINGRNTFVAAGTIALGLLFGFGIPQVVFKKVHQLFVKA